MHAQQTDNALTSNWYLTIYADPVQNINKDKFTKKWNKLWVVVWHDEQIDRRQARARLQVAKRKSNVVVLGTARNENLKAENKMKALITT